MSEIWEITGVPEWEDRLPRGNYVIPCLLHDKETNVLLKAVILDLSGTGCRVFTNDRRVVLTDPQELKEKTFIVEFDFHDVDTGGIEGRIRHIHPGHDPLRERQMGLEFTKIPAVARRDINRIVRGDVEAGNA